MLVLASSSPRRQELLIQMGLCYELINPDIDEAAIHERTTKDRVLAIAKAKLEAAVAMTGYTDTLPVLAADTSIECNKVEFGKPLDEHHASQMLRALSGRAHQVYTAVVVKTAAGVICDTVTTTVWFRQLSDEDIGEYCRSKEPLGKAGAYAIQGKGAMFVKRIDGSYSNVVGLPIFETANLLKTAGVAL